MPDFWFQITHLGNSILLLITAALMTLWFLLSRATPLARRWSLLLGSAVLLVLATKVAFLGWGIGIAAIDFTGISGHAMLSAAVLSSLLVLLSARQVAPIRRISLMLCLAVLVLVGVSRLVLNTHSLSEVLLGWATGAAVAWPVGYWISSTVWQRSPWPMGVVFVVLFALSLPRGNQAGLETHGLVIDLALWASGRTEPYTRQMLHQRTGANNMRRL